MDDKVVLRYRDGRTERATLAPIDPSTEVLLAHYDDGGTAEVPFTQLKAVFFPRAGDGEAEAASGMQIAIEFNDGEIIRGTAQYNPERNGFFLYPEDRSKNDRIFVVNSAIVSIEVEKM
ncbi:MAG: hypothetical protein JO197_20175 [Acidobacteria bacterium]|nr:hypothetical protein [Acidobacteriota bacterium]MBV9474582.1 hypothetical protein [Acidobacteriota bacterium]